MAGLGPVFAKALAKDAGDRYPRCVDFAGDLRRGMGAAELECGAVQATAYSVTAGQPKKVVKSAGRHAKPERGRSRGRRMLIPAILGAVVIVAGATAGATVVLGHRDAPTATAQQPVASPPPPPAVSGRMDLPIVVIGANCAVLGAAAVSEAGAPAYCAHANPGSDPTVWSLQSEKLISDPESGSGTGSG